MEAGEIAKERFGNDGVYRTKAHKTDYVTQSDLLIHELITAKLAETYPDHHIISEEDDSNHDVIENGVIQQGSYWVLDPIDGTNNFATRIPLFGTMLCHLQDGIVTETGIYLPMADEYYSAQKGNGAYLNESPIQCTTHPTWEQTFGCTNANLSQKKVALRTALSKAWEQDKFWLSAYGSAAVSGSFIASGKRDWYMTMGSQLWDYAPLSLLLSESGCLVTNFTGETWKAGDRNMIAANPKLHATLFALLD